MSKTASDTEKAPATPKPLRLLIADDNPDDIALCLLSLKKAGMQFHADTASSREEFARILREHSVDTVLCDFRMDGWTAIDALAMVKEISPEVPLILLTGTLGDELSVDCIKRGAIDYVLKNQLVRLPRALARAMEEKALREAQRHAAEDLRESEARFRSMVDNAVQGIYWVTMPSGELLYANPAMVEMLGYALADELLAKGSTKDIYNDPEAREKIHAEYLKHGHVDAIVEWKRKDGKIITVRLHGRRARDLQKGNEYAEVIVEDITERTAIQKQLIEAQKFEAIGQLAGGIAHDFNNMIGAILGWADLGIEETEAGSRLHRHFEKVRQQAARAASLTRQLLAFARRQILEPRDMDLNLSVIETLSLLEKVIGSNIEIKAQVAPDLAVVRADPTQIEQVLMNLCINARDAMPNGGSLTVETSNVNFDEAACAFRPLARPGRYAMLAVTDTGTGMDATTLDRIFEPFFTTKELGKGTGLGLATVYGIVRQHGGFLDVYSEPGVGSTFHAYLPVSAAVGVAPSPPEETGASCGGSETILIAEDHEGLRQLAVETLSSLGYQVIVTTDGEQALREIEGRPNSIHLVLLDVMLPKLSGPEVYARLNGARPSLPVIFTTGYSADLGSLGKIRQQGLPVLQKPYTRNSLARKVRETLDERVRTR